MKKYKNTRGFTLIEIMVTVAIVGIFASIALPSFAKIIESNRISTATNELVSSLLLARSEALKRRNTVTVCPSVDQNSCSGSNDFSKGWMIFVDCTTAATDTVPENGLGKRVTGKVDDCGENEREEIIKIGEGSDSLLLKNEDIKHVSFGFSGRLAGRASTFVVGKDAENKKKKVVLSRVGRVRVEDL